ncbi:helix-turn-helix domain-containing protein [Citricoccus sp. I39-566]|uniref:helix-turn-helix domain-containing protein n=1 Tax=Citricoccus sp. I39-566 TaxID=3073268 RepID=UPI002869FBB9|nr:helix-turn-helix domain-containing protein [Citricoccus sp. I39-566]WMY80012.1 helix-turn-helix domain-containing protein [Citricoccus sp. I39-566]
MDPTTRGFQTALEDFLGDDVGDQVLTYALTHRAAEHLEGYPDLLTLEEVAHLLNADPHEVLQVTGDDELPAIEIGTSIRRYRREDVHNYLRYLSEKPTPVLG